MRYFFHVQQGEQYLPDEIGEELPSREAAWKEATVTTGQLLEDLDGELNPDKEWLMQITDGSGNLIWVFRLTVEKH
ncbi:hypothetical protein ACVIGA_001690 [Bradyrhizobium sp. USDA 3240]